MTRPFVWALLAFQAMFVALLAVQDGGWRSSPVAAELTVLGAAVVAGAACLHAARREPGRRQGWMLLLGAVSAWSIANGLRASRLRSGLDASFIPMAEAMGIVAPVLAGAAVLWLTRSLAGRVHRVRVVLDGGLIAIGSLFAMWALAPELPGADNARGAVAAVVPLVHPAIAVTAAAVASIALARSRRQERPTLVLLACGLVMVALADGTISEAAAAGIELPRTIILGGWLAAYLLFTLAAVQPSPPPARVAMAFDDLARAPLSTLLLPYVPLLGAACVAAFRLVVSWPWDARLAVGGFVLLGLVVSRQLVSLFDNRHLVRSLHSTVKELRQRERELRHQALHDTLTGLANRTLFWDSVEKAIARSRRRGGPRPAVLFLDLDGFKAVNDRLGHGAGDQVLRQVADRLRSCVRAEETLARLGGDEFALVVENGDDEAVRAVAQRLLDTVSQPYRLGEEDVTVGVSIGIATVGAGTEPVDHVVRRADAAMYRAKAAGKGRVVAAAAPADAPALTQSA